MQPACGFDLALQTGAPESVLHVGCAKAAQHFDDRILTKVGGIRHGWTPIAFYTTRILI